MALVPAIEFGDLASQLTDEETTLFINNLAVSHHQLIIELLSVWFTSEATTETNDPFNLHCNESITTIIRSRKDNNYQSSAAALDTLPRRMIGLCSAFLDQKSYRALSLCNRATYLGANCPIMLRELKCHFPTDSNHLAVHLPFFPMVKKLTLKASVLHDSTSQKPKEESQRQSDVVQLIVPQIAEIPRLQTLELCELSKETTKRIIAIEANWNLRCLSLRCDSIPSLTPFKNLQYLHLIDVDVGTEANDSHMTAMARSLRSLRGLKLNTTCRFSEKILTAIGHQLEYLELNSLSDDVHLRDAEFGNLRQFRVSTFLVSWNVGRALYKTARNLEKLQIGFSVYEDYPRNPNDYKFISGIFGHCENLNYLEISSVRGVGEVLHEIHNGLCRSAKDEKQIFKIRIFTELYWMEQKKMKKFVWIIKKLCISKVDQWMVLFGTYKKRYAYTAKQMVTDLRALLKVDVRISVDKKSNAVVITNPKCTIPGYAARWLMS